MDFIDPRNLEALRGNETSAPAQSRVFGIRTPRRHAGAIPAGRRDHIMHPLQYHRRSQRGSSGPDSATGISQWHHESQHLAPKVQESAAKVTAPRRIDRWETLGYAFCLTHARVIKPHGSWRDNFKPSMSGNELGTTVHLSPVGETSLHGIRFSPLDDPASPHSETPCLSAQNWSEKERILPLATTR